jgi:O-antigen/teichoic acid export membrane protein
MLIHLKPILIIFSSTLATIIYINSDTTMLGAIKGVKEVALYSVAGKLYNCIKTILNSLVPVFMTRMAFQYYSDKKEYETTFIYAFDLLTFLTIPLTVGSWLYSEDLINLIAGPAYQNAVTPMKILFSTMLFATLGNLYCSGGLLLINKEKIMLYATVLGATINVIGNFYIIPVLGSTGAAITTLITEIVVNLILFFSVKQYMNISIDKTHIIKCILSTFPFAIIYIIEKKYWLSSIAAVFGIAICIIAYMLVLLAVHDQFTMLFIKNVYYKIKNGVDK